MQTGRESEREHSLAEWLAQFKLFGAFHTDAISATEWHQRLVLTLPTW